MRKKVGKFVSIEGGEGAGKSTQAKKLAAALKKCGIDCLVTREPGGSKGAEEIRKLLVEGKPGRWDALTETLLFFAARHDHVENTIKPALAEGTWIICDRFADSTYAYQGAGGGLDRETVRRIESVAIRDFKPDLTLILDQPVEIGLERANARAGKETRFEQFGTAFHEKMRAGFLDIAKRARERCVVIDATGSEADVAEKVFAAVAARFGIK
jgi:dTMP kinase